MPSHYLKTELYSRLRDNPQIFDFIQEAALDGLWLWDLENPEHEWMSSGFWRLFGYEPEEKQHLASEWQDMIFDEDREKALANFKAHLADPDHPYDQIVRYRHKKGHTVWVRCRGLALRDESGAATRLLGAHVDISEVVALRQGELEDTTSLLTQVLNTASSGIIGLNEKGMILSINPAARHMLGAINDSPPFAWPSSIQFLDNEDLHPLTAADSPLARALQGKQVKQEIHLITRAKSVTNRYVRISSSPIESETSPVRFVMLMDDVSEQEMNRQQVERKSRLDALGQLTGGIAHDFNNLLATVQYATRLIEDAVRSAEAKDHLRIIQDSIERGADLTNRLLAFAKRQFGLVKTHDCDYIVEEFEKLVRPAIEESISIDVKVEEEKLYVYCDHPQLENALLNLVLNSRDAILRSGEGGRITVAVRGLSSLEHDETLERELAATLVAPHAEEMPVVRGEDDGMSHRFVEFSVSDNGPGMPPEVQRRAVDPFFTTKATNSGTGLGLSMVYGFVQQSDGVLRIYSEEGEGTTVRLILPRGDAANEREAPQELPAPPIGSGERILIAEDDLLLQSVIRGIIRSFGYDVTIVSSGRAALDMLEAGEPFDLLLTDVVMPGGIGGFELARRAREIEPRLPIIYMSGYAGLQDEDMGPVVAPVVRKPCKPDQLAEVIAEAIKSRKGKVVSLRGFSWPED